MESNINSLKGYINSKQQSSNIIEISWLGQAGFALKFNNKLILLDPYLSDYLSKKYEATIFSHTRLMNIPITPEEIDKVDYVLCSHAHSDHMDPETLQIISQKNSKCKFVVPAAEFDEAISKGVNSTQIITSNDNNTIKLDKGIKITGIAASHEELKLNSKGEHHFLGYIIDFDGVKIYHSGDCIPYEGLSNKLKDFDIDIALLPINGRDDYRLKNEILGNFTISEVIDLCLKAEIKKLIVHHFGMFAFNTVAAKELEDLEKIRLENLQIIIPKINKSYKIEKK
jgi:L-ascorbate metabolism protein UlaG (beta-lactamase superfamily)